MAIPSCQLSPGCSTRDRGGVHERGGGESIKGKRYELCSICDYDHHCYVNKLLCYVNVNIYVASRRVASRRVASRRVVVYDFTCVVWVVAKMLGVRLGEYN